jgi:hypothetical protein
MIAFAVNEGLSGVGLPRRDEGTREHSIASLTPPPSWQAMNADATL